MRIFYQVYVCIIFILLLDESKAILENTQNTGWNNWTHESVVSTQWVCPKRCNDTFETSDELRLDKINKCCFHYARPFWNLQLWHHLVRKLHVEYLSRTGKAVLYNINSNTTSLSFFEVVHPNGFLSKMPINICTFKTIVNLDFSNNSIRQIANLRCLSKLDKLILKGNKVTSVNNSTFTGMKYLRFVDLSHNRIDHIDPLSFSITPGSLMHVYLSYNQLVSVDITNVVLEKFFAVIDYSYNQIENLSNRLNWKCCKKKEEQADGGVIRWQYNSFRSFPNLTEIGFSDPISTAKLTRDYGMNVTNNKWNCDCKFYPFLEKALEHFDRYPTMTDQYDAKCNEPSHLTNYSVIDFKDKYDLLICNLNMSDKCPIQFGCNCFYQPSQNRTVVNCSGLNMTEFPKIPQVMPDFDNLEIDFSNNNFEPKPNWSEIDYLIRVKKLDLSNNNLLDIDFTAFNAEKLTSLILLNNPIVSIYRSIENLAPCVTQIGNISIDCECNSMWMERWVKNQMSHNCYLGKEILCKIGSKYITLSNLTSVRDQICPEESVPFGFIFALISTHAVVISFLCFKFRYEIFLIYRKIGKRNYEKCTDDLKYDAYFSFDGELYELRLWTSKILLRYLEKRGYKVFYPLRDCILGYPREEDICRKISQSATFIVFLSHSFLDSPNLRSEWKYIWHSYKENKYKQLIVINFDDMEPIHVEDDRMRAFVRLSYYFEFFNTNSKLLSDIEKQLFCRKLKTKRNRIHPGPYKGLYKICSEIKNPQQIIRSK
ncbi:protein toll-like [Mytilus galloprovincialis]|uniref:protein toll-like n=1 Tax=Mytilus galloprovincialis TaxID=29158 RepID=UPI003F7C7EE6